MITLVTPCYQTPKYFLERLFLSIVQIKDLVEWVLVDDSPNSPVVSEFAARASQTLPHFKFIRHSQNRGIRQSYISGFSQAEGRFVGIVDHDDEVDFGYLVRALDVIGDEDFDIVYTNEIRFNHVVGEVYIKPNFDPLSAFYYYYPHHITLFRSDIGREIVSLPEALSLSSTTFDIAFWYEYLSSFQERAPRALHLPFTTYGWRVHEGSTASSVHQKTEHLYERRNLADAFISKFEADPYQILNRTDVPYVIQGKFGMNFSDGVDYAGEYFDVEYVDVSGGEIRQLDRMGATPPELSALLKKMPLRYVSVIAAERLIYVPFAGLLDRDSGHVHDVPYLKEADRLSDGRYLALKSKRRCNSAISPSPFYEISMAGSI
ncbi:glycosyltransferase [Pararhizobium sp. DWP1-1-3]|uniref:glycosyltransferase n=1 Tax=Pararhizobium sp. DWP1-1-3 TaxID=2804652 RepID=UPI003CF9DEB7